MELMEESFPRGGTKKKTAGLVAKKRPREDDGNLFSMPHEEEEIKKKKRKDNFSEKPKTLQFEKKSASKDKALELLNYKSLNVGMLFLGCVKETRDFELTISLPHGLTGYVQATNICEAYTQLLNEQVEKDEPLEALSSLSNLYLPGMLVRCAVSSLETTSGGSHSIKLSLNPKMVNAGLTPSSLQTGMFLCGCVSSIEDHGYLIDLGIGGNKAFLPRQKAQVYLNQTSKAASLCVGQYLNCVIDEIKNDGRLVRLSITQSDVLAAIATEEQEWTMNNLLPGLVVKAQIQEVFPNRIVLSFLSSYTGVVDFLHFAGKKVNSYEKGQTVKACVLWVDRPSKNFRLSLRKCFLQPGSSVKQLSSDWIGTIHERCTVKSVYKNAGAVCQIDGESLGFAFQIYLGLSKLKTLDHFKEGTVHKGRVVGFSPMEEILLLSFKAAIIDGPYLRREDVQVGQILEGTVNRFSSVGMVVDITNHLDGLVPKMHLGDVTVQQPEKKYPVGSKIKCRVLIVDPSARKLILTRKKILMNSTLPILTSYHDATPGLITHGFICAVKNFGCVIKFYNEVQGLVPLRELSTQYIATPEGLFYKGQVVKVRVLECNPEKGTLRLSFKLNNEEENEVQNKKAVKNISKSCDYGKIVNVKIVSKADDGLAVLMLPEERPAFLPKTHLSDYITSCELLWHSLKKDDQLSNVMLLGTSKGKTILTRKSALISYIENNPVVKDISDLSVGMAVPGFVKNIMPFGIFVELPYGFVGLVPKLKISDKFVTNMNDHFVMEQTVVAKITNVDPMTQRLLLTLQLSECAPDDRSAESLSLLSQYFSEVQFSRSLLSRDEHLTDGENLYSLVPGKKLTLIIEEVDPMNDLVLFNVHPIAGVQKISAVTHSTKAERLVAGQKVKVVVLHVDLLKSHVHVSLDESVWRNPKGKVIKGTTYSVVVQHVAEEFAVVSLEDTSRLAAVPLSCHFNDTFRFNSEKLNYGQKIFVTVKSTDADELGLILAVQSNTGSMKQISKPAIDHVKQRSMLGELVTGTVKSVKPTYLIVSLADELVGSIHASQILETVPNKAFPTSKLKVNQSVTCRVIGGREVKTHRFLPITHPHFTKGILELSILPSVMDTSVRLPKNKSTNLYLHGQNVTCYVVKYEKEKQYLEVDVTHQVRGRVDLLCLSKSHKVLKKPDKYFKRGQACTATVIGGGLSPNILSLSLIGSCSLKKDSVVAGRVKTIKPASGLEISLPWGKTGNANLFHLGDRSADCSVNNFTVGTLVRCYILSIKPTIQVSLRNSRTCPKSADDVIDKEISSIDDLQEGQLVTSFVKACSSKGIFLWLSSSIVGRVQFKNASEYYVEDHMTYSSHIPKGTLLTAKILSIDREEELLELSLLKKDTGKPDIIPKSAGLTLKKEQTLKRRRNDSESEVKKSKASKDDEDSGVEVNCPETEKGHKKSTQKTADDKPPVPRLQVSSGFSWDVNLNNLKTSIAGGIESSSDSEDEEQQTEAEKTPKVLQKTKLKKETATPNQQPQSVQEFERLVIPSPNNSANWIQYMEFHLQSVELEQARAVAERALQTIYFREEQEKLNVWAAMLNMENTFGTDETLQKVFERAIQYNDPLKAFQHLVDIYIKSEKFKEAGELFNTMVKRFRQEKSVWWKYATFLLKQGQSENTHRLLQRALKCVPDVDHVDLISKFAQLEFRMGDAVQAKALFESTLSSYPKRTDIWSVYIDMMVKHGSQKEVRDIFERVIHLSLAPKRIKFFFKRYLEYEKKHGNEKTVQAVKEKALKYVTEKGSMTTT